MCDCSGSEVAVVSLATGNDNPEVGTETLTQMVREVLQKVFDTSLERIREVVHGRCEECGKKRHCGSLGPEPQFAKYVKS
ncbi:hypothetical protein J1N35_024615 [Gossypium stocksii]|uniref:Uncharacterized protein n=1 Tax=Gossypium stocksii TaxID=47602 RepID=A0A9D3ZWG0_9ROSI|nr:hypothetical protein J1N35_024615 [Gossypium stocksii]